ncbi:hypothetical protein RvY_19265 [Ramazzottius varieornatus]|uniref:DRBM domain-containing protein n=1 Tax=Ramazzottius varieornatus TaxID=947166 RepID=A0A1D1W8U0_RAMVA|nr:hypothetical protein RvY_19265 [Ramazzottius varieornatus]
MDVQPAPVAKHANRTKGNDMVNIKLQPKDASSIETSNSYETDYFHPENGTSENGVSVQEYLAVEREQPTDGHVMLQAANGQEQAPPQQKPPQPEVQQTQYSQATLVLYPGPNPIGALYEFAQKCKWERPVYDEVETPGYDPKYHKQGAWGRFHATLTVPGQNLKAYAYGNKKATAKKQAAENLIAKINGYTVNESNGINAPLYTSAEYVRPGIDKVDAGNGADGEEQAPIPTGKRQLDASIDSSGPEEKLPLKDPLNPFPSLQHILKKCKWPQATIVDDEDKSFHKFTTTVCVGPADDPERFRTSAAATKMREAKQSALMAMFKELESSRYFMGLWRIVSELRTNGNTPAKRAKVHKAIVEYGLNNTAFLTTLQPSDMGDDSEMLVDSALQKQGRNPASTPYQSMGTRLGLVLKHMKDFAKTAASFLGSPSVEEANGWGDGEEKRRYVPCSALLETVARKMPAALSMTVHFDKETNVEASEEDLGEPKKQEVGLEVRWCDENTAFPRSQSLRGTGPSYMAAKDNAASKFFLHYGLRDDEFEILRVG